MLVSYGVNREWKSTTRRKLTESDFRSERWFLEKLKNEKIGRFRRNFPVGQFFADFCWWGPRIIVEIDGSSHQTTQDYDRNRDNALSLLGFRVFRIDYGNETQATTVIEFLKNHPTHSLKQRIYKRRKARKRATLIPQHPQQESGGI